MKSKKTCSLTIRLSDDVRKLLVETAEERGQTLTTFIERAIKLSAGASHPKIDTVERRS